MADPAFIRKPIILIALGGNALIRKGQRGTIDEQFDNLRIPIRQIAKLSQHYRVIITHGNGPQVGDLLLRQDACRQALKLPLEILVAQTQGQIGYMIESTLDSELMKLGIDDKPLVSLISYVVVNEADAAFSDPTKPIGPSYTEAQAEKLDFPVKKTAKGYRRVVVSPKPVTIVEKREIKKLIEMDFIVICCGGGGIPVIREERSFQGVNAVIDKDLASAKLAEEVGVDVFVIATDVGGVAIDFGAPNPKYLKTVSLKDARKYLREGQFPPGSMGPKVEAALAFASSSGKKAIITSIDTIESALSGAAGTEFLPDA